MATLDAHKLTLRVCRVSQRTPVYYEMQYWAIIQLYGAKSNQKNLKKPANPATRSNTKKIRGSTAAIDSSR